MKSELLREAMRIVNLFIIIINILLFIIIIIR